MAETLLQLKKRVSTFVRYQPDPDELRTYVNEGLRKAFAVYTRNKSNVVKKKTTLNLLANATEVALPADFKSPSVVIFTGTNGGDVKAEKVSEESWPYFITRNTPSLRIEYRWVYTIIEKKLHIWPSREENTTVELWYYSSNANLTQDTDQIDLPDLALDVAVNYARYLALASTGDPDFPDAKDRYRDARDELEMTDARTENEIQMDWVEPYGAGQWTL